MALADQSARANTMTHYQANPLVGMTTNGCVDLQEVVASCAGFPNRLAHTTVIAQNFPTQCC
jgi:hypothetical protein